MSLTGKREGGAAQRRKLVRETYSDGAPRLRGPAGLAGRCSRLGREMDWHGRVGLAREDPGEKSNTNLISNFK
jgi:hypothetical protein